MNVASRLEGLSKEYATRMVIGEGTRQAAEDLFTDRFLDVVAVKGRSEPLAVYEILGRKSDLTSLLVERADRHQTGIELYRTRRWAEAAVLFEEIHSAEPEDGPTSLYLRRSRAVVLNPPPADWDGVHGATTK